MAYLSGVPLATLRAFEVAGRHAGFTAAAGELGTTQSAVSQQIRQLENHLGLPLFERIHRGVRLTTAGQVLLASVQQSLADMERTIADLQRQQRRPCLNILTDFALAAYWLMPRLPEFRRLHPGIDVNIVTRQGVLDWRDRSVDVAIVFCNARQLARVPRLSSERVVPVCSPAFLQTYGPINDFKALSQVPLLSLLADEGQSWLDWPTYFHRQAGIHYPASSTLTFNNYTLLIQAAIAGHGIGLGWRGLVDSLLDAGILVALEDLALVSEGGYGVIDVRPDLPGTPKRALLRWLMANAAGA